MPRTAYDYNPHLSILDDRQTKDKIAEVAKRVLDLASSPPPPISDEQLQHEVWQYESNAFAEQHPMYAAARSAAGFRAIIPLQPLGVEPLVSPSKATNDPHVILDWFKIWPEANIGVPVGRANNLIAVHVQDTKAARRLRRLTGVERQGKEKNDGTFDTYIEHRPLDSGWLRYVSTRPFTVRHAEGWGKELDRKWRKLTEQNASPEESWLLWSYPSPMSGMDAFNFVSRRVVTGVDVLGDGEVIPWAGSRFADDLALAGPGGPLSEMPLWLAKEIGRPRSRKAMKAAREAFEAAQRTAYAHTDVEVLKLVEARKFAQAEAEDNARRTSEALAKVDKDEPKGELPPVLPDEPDEPESTGGWG